MNAVDGQPIIVLKFTPAGAELVLHALNQLPRGQVDALWQQTAAQYQQQVQELQRKAAEAPEAAGLTD